MSSKNFFTFEFICFFQVLMTLGVTEENERPKCLNLDVAITQQVENEGFHRDIKWLVELQSPSEEIWRKSLCQLALQLDVPQGMFVNPDQVADLKRAKKLNALIKGKVDIEIPLHEATEHKVYIYLNDTGIEKTLVTLPVHLRYQRSQMGGGFGKVILPKPSLLASCSETLDLICGKDEEVSAPRNSSNCRSLKSWKNVTYQALFEEVELFVPIGDLDHYPLVSIVTLLLGCTGCIYILSVLSMSHF